MLQRVRVGHWRLRAYRDVAPRQTVDALAERARALRGARILVLSATPYGGGVSELLRSEVPLLADLGLAVEWHVMGADDRFFSATKAIHNALQGGPHGLTADERSAYLEASAANAAELEGEWDFVVVHDPQPAALLALSGKRGARWIWRCHIDTSSPHREVWEFMRTYLAGYDAAVFTMRGFVPPDLPIERVEVVPPAIDPLSPKNLPLPDTLAAQVLDWIGVDLEEGPLVTQVSRFDPWKDPLGVLAAYRQAREHVPGLQLALVGSMALDDPEGWEIYRQVTAATADDPKVHVYTNLTGVSNVEVNAFQRLSDVVIQKSLREGFGLVVAESLWKGTPVVAGRAGGIPLQMAEGVGGVLVDGIDDCARALVTLLSDRERGLELGRRGRERVREHFLLPRLMLDELALLSALAAGEPLRPSAPLAATTGPLRSADASAGALGRWPPPPGP